MDDQGSGRHDHDEQELPTTDHPLHGAKRPLLGPAVLTILVVGLAVLAIYLGFHFLVQAD